MANDGPKPDLAKSGDGENQFGQMQEKEFGQQFTRKVSNPIPIPGASRADEDDFADDVEDTATLAMSISSRGAFQFGLARSQSPAGTKGSFEPIHKAGEFICGSPPGKNKPSSINRKY